MCSKYPLSFEKESIKGSFVHGIFDDNAFRTQLLKTINPTYKGFDFQAYKSQTVEKFIETMKAKLDVQKILDAL